MTNIYSCRWNRSVLDNPEYRMPMTASEYVFPTVSPWTAPLRSLAVLDWQATALPAAMYGASAGSPELPVNAEQPDSLGYRLAAVWNRGADGIRQIVDPAAAADAAGASIDNRRISYDGSATPISRYDGMPEGVAVMRSPAMLPSYGFVPGAGCAAAGTCSGLGDVSEVSDVDRLVRVIDRPRPSISSAPAPLLLPANNPNEGSTWCDFARWVDRNPILAVAACAALYLLRSRR